VRSLLFVPGDSPRKVAKAAASSADVVIFDLEDAVRPDAKSEARSIVRAALEAPRGGPLRYVRVNSLGAPGCDEDLEAVLPLQPDGVMLPKLEGPHDLVTVSDKIERLEPADRAGRTKIIAVCTETPAATLSLASRSWAHPRLAGLLWGGEDLSVALGSATNRDDAGLYTAPFALARSLCLLAARAAGATPIDAVFTNFRNDAGLRNEAEAARRDGFSAKAAIHPAQIETINACFSPTDAERAWAQRVIEAFERDSSGALQLDGGMLDAPHLERARRIMATAQRK
jgi:citrate lyase subunit beta/citryl-CoA lyase